MPGPAVVIAASSLMPSLREHLSGDGDLLVFPDTEPIQALQAILEHKPPLIVLERLFAATPRGAALVNRINNDPQLAHAEVRVVSHSGEHAQVLSTGGAAVPAPPAPPRSAGTAPDPEPTAPAAVATAEPQPRLDWHGTRRAQRYRIRRGVEIQLDGTPVELVDLSLVGAQVVSATILRPNQRVRVSVPNQDFLMRFRGSVAWAKFELPNPAEPPVYRAGIEFADADPAALDAFCQRNRE